MSPPYGEAVRINLEHLVNGPDDQRRNALAELASLADADKRDAIDYILERLPKEQDSTLRGWYLSALAAINLPETESTVVAYLDPNTEREEDVRGWATIAVAKIHPKDLERHLLVAKSDRSSQVRAIALRSLIENGIDEETHAVELLKIFRTPRDVGDRLAVLKALRASAGNAPLPRSVEKRLLPVLQTHLLTAEGVETEQRQGVLVLGDFKHEWEEAIGVLSRVLELHQSSWVRRDCVKALTNSNRPGAKKAFALAIRDKDQEVRSAAANGLRQVLGTSEAVQFLAEEYVLREDYPSAEYIAALRNIDRTAAADLLLKHLQGGDARSASRALQALALLGVEGATRVFRSQRVEVVESYAKSLSQIDSQVFAQISNLTKQAEKASSTSMRMYVGFFIFGLVILSFGLLGLVVSIVATETTSVAITATPPAVATPTAGAGGAVTTTVTQTVSSPTVGNTIGATAGAATSVSISVVAVSLITLLLLFYRNPLDRIRRSAAGFVQVNVAFLGYIRQIHQIDLVFKQMFITEDRPNPDQVKENVEQIRSAVEHTVEEVRSYLLPD